MQRLFNSLESGMFRGSVCQQASAANMKVDYKNEALSLRGTLAVMVMFVFHSPTAGCWLHKEKNPSMRSETKDLFHHLAIIFSIR